MCSLLLSFYCFLNCAVFLPQTAIKGIVFESTTLNRAPASRSCVGRATFKNCAFPFAPTVLMLNQLSAIQSLEQWFFDWLTLDRVCVVDGAHRIVRRFPLKMQKDNFSTQIRSSHT